MKTRSLMCRVAHSGRAPADGVPCSANVPRPAASSFISLRKAPHRRERDAEQSLISDTPAACPVHRASGAPRSEIKEEPKAGDIRGGEYPMPCALDTLLVYR